MPADSHIDVYLHQVLVTFKISFSDIDITNSVATRI